MRRYRVRLSREATADLDRLHSFMLEHDDEVAYRALEALENGWETLARSPFICRKARHQNSPVFRELVIDLGRTGYVALFRIDDAETLTVLAIRHQRESDYH